MVHEFAGFSLDAESKVLRHGAELLHLSPKAFDLLSLLVDASPRVVPKRELYDRLWPETFVVEGNLHVLVSEIRRALGDDDRRIVRTVHGTGYACGVPVRRSSQAVPLSLAHLLRHGSSEVALAEGENVVGREADAQLCLPSPTVSRRHAIILVRGETATLRDLESKNGTFVGAKRLRGETVLEDGSIVRFGSVEVLYRRAPADQRTETL
jgi:DNA-binding winged helix-turn-helix (wHTH) protein